MEYHGAHSDSQIIGINWSPAFEGPLCVPEVTDSMYVYPNILQHAWVKIFSAPYYTLIIYVRSMNHGHQKGY